MKNLTAALAIVVFFVLGSRVASGLAASGEIIFFGLIVGSVLGAVGALAYLAQRHDYVWRIGNVVILFLGGVAVFAPPQAARCFVPSVTVGLILGALGLLVALSKDDDPA